MLGNARVVLSDFNSLDIHEQRILGLPADRLRCVMLGPSIWVHTRSDKERVGGPSREVKVIFPSSPGIF